jgi:16S rRNA G966 N2-methylase RsmD
MTTEKKDFLFRFVNPDIRKKIKLDEEALYSTTDQVTADKITRDILNYIPKSSTITDATACIGGSAYSFAQQFSNVIAIENNKERYELLKHNMNILRSQQLLLHTNTHNQNTAHNPHIHCNIYNKLQQYAFMQMKMNNVECRHGDALIECQKQFQDAIFIDPPWGGPEYKTLDKVQLYLSGLPLHQVCKNIYKYTDYIIIKVPVNFDEVQFINDTQTFMELQRKNSQLRKMKILIFQTIHTNSNNS